MTERRATPASVLDATWPLWQMPSDVRRQGPWGQLNAWDHPRLTGEVKRYAASADVWVHAGGSMYYMQFGSWHATVTLPGPSCTCRDVVDPCIHLRLIEVLRGPP